MKTKFKVYLDSNVFIFGHLFEESNSRKILQLVEEKEIEAIVSDRVALEVERFFEKNFGNREAFLELKYIHTLCKRIPIERVKNEMNKFKNQIKEKDLEQIAVTKKLKLNFIISLDRHFKSFSEYITPKKFIEEIGLKARKTEY